MKIKIILLAVLLVLFLGTSLSVSAMTETERQALIVQLQTQINALIQQVLQMIAQHTFNTSLGYANSGTTEVAYLHLLLQKEGISYTPDGINAYGPPTRDAVIQLQIKYGLPQSSQTGYFGVATRVAVNQANGNTAGQTSGNTTSSGTCQSFLYNPYGACTAAGFKTRTVASAYPLDCTGGYRDLSQPCTPTPCTSVTYSSPWSACSNGIQVRSITSSLPSGCVVTNPLTVQSCTCVSATNGGWSACDQTGVQTMLPPITYYPAGCSGGNIQTSKICTPPVCTGGNCTLQPCTEANWSRILTPPTCPASGGSQTVSWVKGGNCTTVGGVNHLGSYTTPCPSSTRATCGDEVGTCITGSATPAIPLTNAYFWSCGGGGYTSITCQTSTTPDNPTTCTYTPNPWSSCVGGEQELTFTSSPAGCVGTPPQTSTRACECTGFDWGPADCAPNTQQKATSTPAGCIGGTPLPWPTIRNCPYQFFPAECGTTVNTCVAPAIYVYLSPPTLPNGDKQWRCVSNTPGTPGITCTVTPPITTQCGTATGQPLLAYPPSQGACVFPANPVLIVTDENGWTWDCQPHGYNPPPPVCSSPKCVCGSAANQISSTQPSDLTACPENEQSPSWGTAVNSWHWTCPCYGDTITCEAPKPAHTCLGGFYPISRYVGETSFLHWDFSSVADRLYINCTGPLPPMLTGGVIAVNVTDAGLDLRPTFYTAGTVTCHFTPYKNNLPVSEEACETSVTITVPPVDFP